MAFPAGAHAECTALAAENCSTLLPTPTSRLQTSAPMQHQELSTHPYGSPVPWIRLYVSGCLFPTCQHRTANIPMLPWASPLLKSCRAGSSVVDEMVTSERF